LQADAVMVFPGINASSMPEEILQKAFAIIPEPGPALGRMLGLDCPQMDPCLLHKVLLEFGISRQFLDDAAQGIEHLTILEKRLGISVESEVSGG